MKTIAHILTEITIIVMIALVFVAPWYCEDADLTQKHGEVRK